MLHITGCYQHTAFLPYIYAKFSGRDPSRGNRLFFCGNLHPPDRNQDDSMLIVRKDMHFFSFYATFSRKRRTASRPPARMLKVLCYSETELSSAPIHLCSLFIMQ